MKTTQTAASIPMDKVAESVEQKQDGLQPN